VRQHCLLKFSSHFQILLKGFILFWNSLTSTSSFSSASYPGCRARETKGADDLSVGSRSGNFVVDPRVTPIGSGPLFVHVRQKLSRTQNLLFIAERCPGVLESEQVGVGCRVRALDPRGQTTLR